jgi:hypothetical protein
MLVRSRLMCAFCIPHTLRYYFEVLNLSILILSSYNSFVSLLVVFYIGYGRDSTLCSDLPALEEK